MNAPKSYPWEILAPQLPIWVMIFGAKKLPALGERTQNSGTLQCIGTHFSPRDIQSNLTGPISGFRTSPKYMPRWPNLPQIAKKLTKNGSKKHFLASDGSKQFKLHEQNIIGVEASKLICLNPWNGFWTPRIDPEGSNIGKILLKIAQNGSKSSFVGSDGSK